MVEKDNCLIVAYNIWFSIMTLLRFVQTYIVRKEKILQLIIKWGLCIILVFL